MALLERPAKVFLDKQLLQLLTSQDRPQSLEEILSALRAEGIIHKHDIARAIWRLSEEGRVSVRSGKVVAIRA